MSLGKKIALKYVRSKFKLMAAISPARAAEKAFELFTTPPSRLVKKLPAVFLKAEKLHSTFEGNKIYGYRWNHPAEKKLLILHGFESGVVNFDRYIQPLIKNGYEVVGFDAPAHGKSGGKRINALDYKKLILHLNKLYGPFKYFISHSFGGLALSLALEEMKHDRSYKAVFIAPATESTTAMNQFFQLLQLGPEVRKEFDRLITEANNKPPGWYSVARAAANIKADVLFLQDKVDKLTPFEDVQPIIQKKYPNFRFIISEGLGHRRIYKDQQSIRAILEFLK